jgi:hypothetical protein
MPEPVDFGPEHPDQLQEHLDSSRVDDERGSQMKLGIVDALLQGDDFAQFARDLVNALRDTCADVVVRLRHEADAIRSGSERQAVSSTASECAGELGEDREVGMEPHAGESSDAEGKE